MLSGKISENAIWAVQNRKADMKGMISSDMMLDTEACKLEALSLIGRKSLKKSDIGGRRSF